MIATDSKPSIKQLTIHKFIRYMIQLTIHKFIPHIIQLTILITILRPHLNYILRHN